MKKLPKRNIRAKIKTSDGEIYRGVVNLDSENIKFDRLSDLFVKGSSPFLTVYNLTARGKEDVAIINKAHIISVVPDGNDQIEDEAHIFAGEDYPAPEGKETKDILSTKTLPKDDGWER